MTLTEPSSPVKNKMKNMTEKKQMSSEERAAEFLKAYDQKEHLSDWGFTGTYCNNCGIKNSELAGLLMQCGKCKNAYFCSTKCFNESLPVHNKTCDTGGWRRDPKGSKVTLPLAPKPSNESESPGKYVKPQKPDSETRKVSDDSPLKGAKQVDHVGINVKKVPKNKKDRKVGKMNQHPKPPQSSSTARKATSKTPKPKDKKKKSKVQYDDDVSESSATVESIEEANDVPAGDDVLAAVMLARRQNPYKRPSNNNNNDDAITSDSESVSASENDNSQDAEDGDEEEEEEEYETLSSKCVTVSVSCTPVVQEDLSASKNRFNFKGTPVDGIPEEVDESVSKTKSLDGHKNKSNEDLESSVNDKNKVKHPTISPVTQKTDKQGLKKFNVANTADVSNGWPTEHISPHQITIDNKGVQQKMEGSIPDETHMDVKHSMDENNSSKGMYQRKPVNDEVENSTNLTRQWPTGRQFPKSEMAEKESIRLRHHDQQPHPTPEWEKPDWVIQQKNRGKYTQEELEKDKKSTIDELNASMSSLNNIEGVDNPSCDDSFSAHNLIESNTESNFCRPATSFSSEDDNNQEYTESDDDDTNEYDDDDYDDKLNLESSDIKRSKPVVDQIQQKNSGNKKTYKRGSGSRESGNKDVGSLWKAGHASVGCFGTAAEREMVRLRRIELERRKEIGWEKPEWTKSNKLGMSRNNVLQHPCSEDIISMSFSNLSVKGKNFEANNNSMNNSVVLRHAESPFKAKQYDWEKPEWVTRKSINRSRSAISERSDGGKLDSSANNIAYVRTNSMLQSLSYINTMSSMDSSSNSILMTKEELRRVAEAERNNKSYTWEKPDWIRRSPLKKTRKGSTLVQQSSDPHFCSSPTQLLQSGKVKWQKPDWATNSPLRNKKNKKKKQLNNDGSSSQQLDDSSASVDNKNISTFATTLNSIPTL